MTNPIEGVHCAVATPVAEDGTPDTRLYLAHCRALMEEGCHGLAPLGTTGEANSFGTAQRMALLDALVEGRIPASTLIPGTGTPSVDETVTLTRHAVQSGVKGALVLPPYYYKGVDDEGLYRFYARVIEGVGDDRLRLVLYHIPQISAVPLSHDLIARLIGAFPGIVCGIKDSSGDLANMEAMCARFPGFSVLAGADPLMLPVLKAGGAGCITATSNLRADALRVVWDGWQDPAREAEVAAAQDRINAWRDLSGSYAQIPTTKAMVAKVRGDVTWANTMPPLVALTETERQDVWDRMAALDAERG